MPRRGGARRSGGRSSHRGGMRRTSRNTTRSIARGLTGGGRVGISRRPMGNRGRNSARRQTYTGNRRHYNRYHSHRITPITRRRNYYNICQKCGVHMHDRYSHLYAHLCNDCSRNMSRAEIRQYNHPKIPLINCIFVGFIISFIILMY